MSYFHVMAFRSYLCTLDTKTLSDVCFEKSSQYIFFLNFNNVFYIVKNFSVNKALVSNIYFMECDFDILSKNALRPSVINILSYFIC